MDYETPEWQFKLMTICIVICGIALTIAATSCLLCAAVGIWQVIS